MTTPSLITALHRCSTTEHRNVDTRLLAVALADKFSAKIAALRKSDPIIDWSAAPSGRVAKSLSEV
jgi:hypothetical protein